MATLDDGEFAPTLELKVSFLRPAAPGRMVGTGRVVHRGGSIAFLAGELKDHEGNVAGHRHGDRPHHPPPRHPPPGPVTRAQASR